MKNSGRIRNLAALLVATLTVVVVATAVALAARSSGELSHRERCERSGGIWHGSAGHGSDVAHCMGGDRDQANP